MGNVYEKVPFAWNEPRPPVAVSSQLRFEPVRRGEDDLFSSIILRCVTASLDRGDARFAASADPMRAIRDFLSEADVAFDHLAEWRRIAYTPAGETVGFILPVTFRGCDREGKAEGTIYHMGVLPERRGHGFGRDLVLHATAALQRAGVWRIFCDTDVRNTAMIRTFLAAGYEQAGDPYLRDLD